MYIAPGQGHTTPWGQTFDVNRKLLSLCPFVASLKKEIWFYTHFNDSIYVYSPRARADNPLGTNFWCHYQKALITLPICCRFKKNCFEVQFYVHFFMFHHMYIAPGRGRGRQSIGDKMLMTTERPFLCPYVVSFKMSSSKSDFIHIFNDLYMYIAPGQGQKTPWGQSFDVNRKPLSLRPFVAIFKQISMNSDFIHIF